MLTYTSRQNVRKDYNTLQELLDENKECLRWDNKYYRFCYVIDEFEPRYQLLMIENIIDKDNDFIVLGRISKYDIEQQLPYCHKFKEQCEKIRYRERIKNTLHETYWEMIDGNCIKLKNMKRSHLENSIKMCKRNGSKEWYRLLTAERAIRNREFNEFYNNDDLSDLFTTNLIFDDSKNELFNWDLN